MYKGYGVANGEWMSESILMQDCPDLVNKYRAKYLKLDNNNQPYWSDPLGVKNTKVNNTKTVNVYGRGQGRGRGRGRSSGRGKRGSKRGPGRPRKIQPIYASQIELEPELGPIDPVKPKTVTKSLRRSRRKVPARTTAAVYASDLAEFTQPESDRDLWQILPNRMAESDAPW